MALGALALAAAAASTGAAASARSRHAASRAGSAAASAPKLQFGLADYEPRTFSDPRVAELGIRIARDVVPWNVALVPRDLAAATAWLNAVKRAKITPLITFQHADGTSHGPSTSQLLSAFLKFRKLFPWVTEFCAWDEATHDTQPTFHKPKLAAEYYNVIASHCSNCTVTAPDTLDADDNVEAWIHTFLQTARPRPTIWPFNPYESISDNSPTLIYRFLQAVPGQIWFSEVGGVVWWRFKGKIIYHGEKYAANVAHNIFRLARISPRITRIYYYHWRSPGGNPHKLPAKISWDAGLIRHDGVARPALWVVADELHRHIQWKTPKVY